MCDGLGLRAGECIGSIEILTKVCVCVMFEHMLILLPLLSFECQEVAVG